MARCRQRGARRGIFQMSSLVPYVRRRRRHAALTRWPKQFDVIVTDNLCSAIFCRSDLAAMLTGSSWHAALCEPRRADGQRPARKHSMNQCMDRRRTSLEQGKANPIACVLSASPWRFATAFDAGRGGRDRLEAAVEPSPGGWIAHRRPDWARRWPREWFRQPARWATPSSQHSTRAFKPPHSGYAHVPACEGFRLGLSC